MPPNLRGAMDGRQPNPGLPFRQRSEHGDAITPHNTAFRHHHVAVHGTGVKAKPYRWAYGPVLTSLDPDTAHTRLPENHAGRRANIVSR